MKFVVAILSLSLLCSLWIVFQLWAGGERRGGCGGGSCSPKPDCDGRGGCGREDH
jgi:hypothetical protein